MIHILWVFLFYSFCVGVHIILHRLLGYFHTKSFATVLVFVFGFLALTYFIGIGWWSILYVFLSVLHSVTYTSPYLGQRGPSSVILNFVKKKNIVSEEQIYKLFLDEEMIGLRLSDLKHSGHIREEKGKLYASKKGIRLISLISIYRGLFSWDDGG